MEENTNYVIKDLAENVYCRLKPSKIAGIGTFAIRDIPEGTNPFGEAKMPMEKVAVDAILNNPEIPPAVKEYIEDVCACLGGFFYIPTCGLNGITPDFYLNHSDQPNMKPDEGAEHFISTRLIKAGEELTIDYATYNDGEGLL